MYAPSALAVRVSRWDTCMCARAYAYSVFKPTLIKDKTTRIKTSQLQVDFDSTTGFVQVGVIRVIP
jgi:hypothetical protein